jgi:hypothetical protein
MLSKSAPPMQARVEVPAIARGRYSVRLFDTAEGAVIETLDADQDSGLLAIDTNRLRTDLALAITRTD